MRIEVTKECIAKGVRGDGWNCPVALAIKLLVKRKKVGTGMEKVSIGRRDYRLPDRARRFIRRFDRGETVRPFAFDLEGLT